jgi:hypothetical protein
MSDSAIPPAQLGSGGPHDGPSLPWRCFHCGDIFTRWSAARNHFGATIDAPTACTIDIKRYRYMEQLLARYQEEDTDLHRTINSMRAAQETALRVAEEQGYARGLRDAQCAH